MAEPPDFASVFENNGGTIEDISPPAGPTPDDLAHLFPSDSTQVGAHADPGTRTPRFAGDTSQLPPEACWALQHLVADPYVSRGSKKLWPMVVTYEDQLRQRLSELGLILHMDTERGHAFTRQGEDPSPQSRTILRTKPLTLAASALTLYLYRQHQIAPEETIVETSELVDHMMVYKPAIDTDETGFQKKINAAVNTLADLSILRRIPGTDRYIVSGVIASIITPKHVEELENCYLEALTTADSRPESDFDGDEEDDSV